MWFSAVALVASSGSSVVLLRRTRVRICCWRFLLPLHQIFFLWRRLWERRRGAADILAVLRCRCGRGEGCPVVSSADRSVLPCLWMAACRIHAGHIGFFCSTTGSIFCSLCLGCSWISSSSSMKAGCRFQFLFSCTSSNPPFLNEVPVPLVSLCLPKSRTLRPPGSLHH